MLPLIMAGVGLVGGIMANQQRADEAAKNKQYLAEQEAILKKQRGVSRSMLLNTGKQAALSNTASSRSNALEAFKAEAAGEAGLGVSGTTGGTAFYNLGNMVAQNSQVLREQNQMGEYKMKDIQLQGVAQGLSYDSQQLKIDQAMTEMNDELNYLQSPLAFGLAGLTGAMSGAQMGAGIQGLADKYLGVPQTPETPNAPKLGSDPLKFGMGGLNVDSMFGDQLPTIQAPDWINNSPLFNSIFDGSTNPLSDYASPIGMTNKSQNPLYRSTFSSIFT